MFLPTFFTEQPSARKARLARESETLKRRMSEAVDWDPKMPFSTEMNLKAESYVLAGDLFPGLKPIEFGVEAELIRAGDPNIVVSDDGLWCYLSRFLPAGQVLDVASGSRKGTVLFDGDVGLPALFQRDEHQTWDKKFVGRCPPWMSLTPMETMTLRPGIKQARGHVVITGLGMGWQLIQVSRKRTVEKITVVEISQGLIDFVWDRIKELCDDKPIDLIVDDAKAVLPKLTADVALLDHFPTYGGNDLDRDRLSRKSPGIDNWWAWGSANIADDGGYW